MFAWVWTAILLPVPAMEVALAPDILTLCAQLADAQAYAAQAGGRANIAEAEAANVKAINADLLARNALLELQIEKLRRDRFGARSERSVRLIDQMDPSTRLRRHSKSWRHRLTMPKP